MKPPHRRRLREIWRSAGWPCHDALELELLAGGLLQRHWDAAGRETLHLTEAGVQALAQARGQAQAALSAHEALVARVAQALVREGRLVWRGPALRAALDPAPGVASSTELAAVQPMGAAALWPADALAENPAAAVSADGSAARRWALVRPDVFSIRHTTQEDRTDPMVHEIKVSRADLLADLRNPDKGRAYRALAGRCWYVLREGIAEPQEVPQEYGVLVADHRQLHLARPAPPSPRRLPFSTWMALARLGADRPAGAALGDAAAPDEEASPAQAPLAIAGPAPGPAEQPAGGGAP
jgi:hypothetical protein